MDTLLERSIAGHKNNLSADQLTSGPSVLLQQFILTQTEQYIPSWGTECFESLKSQP
jgi:hypothetical protein